MDIATKQENETSFEKSEKRVMFIGEHWFQRMKNIHGNIRGDLSN